MEEILVTVWCLAYNHEKYIRSALNGFVSQKTNFRYEIIVHDDASTDNTAKIIKEYEEKYPNIIKPIYQKENQYQLGVNEVLNCLLPNMKGKYVALCEGDDFWVDENKLQLQFDYMEKNPNMSMCTHRVQCLNEDGTYNNRVIPESKYNLKHSELLSSDDMISLLYETDGYPFHTSSYFIKKEVFESDIYKQLTGKMNGDQVIVRSALTLGDIFFYDKIMSNRRLFTVGNWNNRFKTWSSSQKMQHFVNAVYANILFDEITQYRFHKKISPYIYRRILYLARKEDDGTLWNLFQDYRENNKFPYHYSCKLTIAYLFFRTFPKVYRLIYRRKI